MRENWEASLDFVWRPENDGQPYHVDAHDSGGGTNMGITEETWAEAVRHGLVKEGPLATAKRDELSLILRVNYWRACACDYLPDGVDLVVFDMAMVAGVGRAAAILQTVLQVEVDRDIGRKTEQAAFRFAPYGLINTLTTDDERYFAGLRAFTWFGRGWDNRAEACRQVAAALLSPREG